MLRIALVSPNFPIPKAPYRGYYAYQTALALQQWAEVEVFCPMAVYPPLLRPRSFRYRRADLEYSPPGIRARYFEYPAIPVVSRPWNGGICAQRLLPYLEEANPDVILDYWVYPEGYASVAAGRKLGKPVVVGALGSDLRLIPDPITRRRVAGTLRKAQFVITVSEDLARIAVGMGAARPQVRAVHNGCDTAVFYVADRLAARARKDVAADAELLVYTGRLEEPKGVMEALTACGELAKRRPRLQMVYVGDGTLESLLRVRAAELGLTGRVRFAGVCTPGEVAEWLAACSLFCLPSYSEGCPNAVVEALACGRAVVATNVGGIPELVRENSGILVPPRDSGRLAQAIEEALRRPWDEAEIARQGRRSWGQAAEETYRICAETVRRFRNGETQ